MKKLWVVILTVLLILSLTACGNNATDTVSSVAPLTGDPMAEVAEVAEYDGYFEEFDKDGNLLRTTDLYPDGSVMCVTERVYKNNVQIGTIATRYDETGAVSSIIEAFMQSESTIEYIYTAERSLIYYRETKYNSDGSSETTNYDTDGNIMGIDVWTTDDNGCTINYKYDAEGNLIGTYQIGNSGNPAGSSESQNIVDEWLDDHTRKAPVDVWSYYIEHYDDNKELIQKDYYLNDVLSDVSYYRPGEELAYKYETYQDGVLDFAREYEYIEVGGESLISLEKITSGNNEEYYSIAKYEYDDKGNVIKLQHEGSYLHDNYTETYTYNAQGLVTTISGENNDGSYETVNEYDAEGLLLKSWSDYSDGSTYVRKYYSNGNIKTEEIGDRSKYIFTSYDENGVIQEERTEDGFGNNYTIYENGLKVEYEYVSPNGSYRYLVKYEYYPDDSIKTELEYENGKLISRTDYDTDGTSTVTEYD